jgi:hypothetical protein
MPTLGKHGCSEKQGRELREPRANTRLPVGWVGEVGERGT